MTATRLRWFSGVSLVMLLTACADAPPREFYRIHGVDIQRVFESSAAGYWRIHFQIADGEPCTGVRVARGGESGENLVMRFRRGEPHPGDVPVQVDIDGVSFIDVAASLEPGELPSNYSIGVADDRTPEEPVVAPSD